MYLTVDEEKNLHCLFVSFSCFSFLFLSQTCTNSFENLGGVR